jgi:hypothetical protein
MLFHWLRKKEQNALPFFYMFFTAFTLWASGFSPTPTWPQYFSAAVPFLILGIFWGVGDFLYSRPSSLWLYLTVLVSLCVLIFTPSVQAMPDQISRLEDRSEWTTEHFQELAESIKEKIPPSQGSHKVLSLVPIFPMQAGLDTYPVFAVGSFSWRTAPILSKERRDRYRIIAPEDLPAYLQKDPPIAILTNTEGGYHGFSIDDPDSLDQPFVEYATQNHYQPEKIFEPAGNPNDPLILWVRN